MKYKFNELIIGSGGINIFCYIGALKSINEYYPLKNFKYLTGSSAGSLLCVLLNIGYTIEDIKELTFKININDFFDIKIINLLNIGGFIDNSRIINLIKSTFITKNISINITFQELYELTNINLTMNSVNQTLNNIEYFNYINTPNMKIIDCMLMSMNIPLIFPPIVYNNNLYVDGAVLDPYPINYHKDTYKLGIVSITEYEKDFIFSSNNATDNILTSSNIDFMTNIKDLCLLIYYNYLKMFYSKKKYKNTIYILNIYHNEFNFNIDDGSKINLYDLGYNKSNLFLKKKINLLKKTFLLRKYFHLLKHFCTFTPIS
jgi:predicted acylesterase/phospholipase RssA